MLNKEGLEKRLVELRQAEGLAWAHVHAVQGRIAEVEYWLEVADGVWTESDLAEAIERGAQEEDECPSPQ